MGKDNRSTEEKIFRAAMTEFIDKGRHGARMQEIANRAEINKAMLHYYFRNKEQLYSHVFQTVFLKVFGSLHHLFEQEMPFSVSLRLFIDGYIDLIKSNPKIPAFIMRELSEGGEVIRALIPRLVKAEQFMLPGLFMRRAGEAMEKGEIRRVDPLQLLMTVIGAGVYFFLAEPMVKGVMETTGAYDRERFLQERKKHIYDIIINGIKS